jgi:cob(I)alamin adenosyltransferase
MKIYTRTGDDGYTGRRGGQRLRKSDPRMGAQGELDELNSMLGWCACQARGDQAELASRLEAIQAELLGLGAMVAAAGTDRQVPDRPDNSDIERLELWIDQAWQQCQPLEHFILPGGVELACRLHVTRAVCRRAERAMVAAAEPEPRISAVIFQYLNRLGDLLFAWARLANHLAGQGETQWPSS